MFFTNSNATTQDASKLITADTGSASMKLAVGAHRIFIPYLGINIPLTDFPARETHSLWLPANKLPDRVP